MQRNLMQVFLSILYFMSILFYVGMNVDVVKSESSPEKFVSTWISFVNLRISSVGTKLKFQEIEKVALNK